VETKKNKYDTNPLDPDVERKAEESWGERGGETQQVGGATRQVGESPPSWTPTPSDSARQNVYSEAPTRRIDNPPLEAPYPSVFVPPTYAPPVHQPPRTNSHSRCINIHSRIQIDKSQGLEYPRSGLCCFLTLRMSGSWCR